MAINPPQIIGVAVQLPRQRGCGKGQMKPGTNDLLRSPRQRVAGAVGGLFARARRNLLQESAAGSAPAPRYDEYFPALRKNWRNQRNNILRLADARVRGI